MEDMTKEEELKEGRSFVQGPTLHILLKRAFEIDPELRVNVLYKDGVECPLLYTGGKFCIKPNKGLTVWLDGELWRGVKIREEDHAKVCGVIEKNEIARVSADTKQRVGFNSAFEKPPVLPSDNAAFDLFAKKIWEYRPRIFAKQGHIELYVENMIAWKGSGWREIILNGLSLEPLFQDNNLFRIKIKDPDIVTKTARSLIVQAESKSKALKYNDSILKRTPVFTIGVTERELTLEVTFVVD